MTFGITFSQKVIILHAEKRCVPLPPTDSIRLISVCHGAQLVRRGRSSIWTTIDVRRSKDRARRWTLPYLNWKWTATHLEWLSVRCRQPCGDGEVSVAPNHFNVRALHYTAVQKYLLEWHYKHYYFTTIWKHCLQRKVSCWCIISDLL